MYILGRKFTLSNACTGLVSNLHQSKDRNSQAAANVGTTSGGIYSQVLQVSTEMKTDTLGGRSALSPECWVKQHCELQVDTRKTPPEPPSFSRPPQGGSRIGKLTLTLSTTRMYSS